MQLSTSYPITHSYLIFSIIFDNFGQLREERRAIYEDLRSVCFICSIKATEFQQSKGFEYHSHHEHNIWHYLFFLVHLKTKDVTEYTSHEQYIAEKLAASDLTFFPINRALSLKKRETNDVEERLKRIEDKLLMINVNGMLSAKIDDDYGSFMVEPPLTTNNTTPGPTTTRRPSLFHLFP